MAVTTERIGPRWETRPQGRVVAYDIVLYRDGEEIDRREEAELIHMLPEDADEAATVLEDRLARRERQMEQRFAERGEKEQALRGRLEG